MTPLARALHRVVRVYQRLFASRPSPCRFVPSCSNYALDALEQHGGVRGGWLTTRRILRCHPWGGSGWDPVPEAGSRGLASVEPTDRRGRSAETLEHRCST